MSFEGFYALNEQQIELLGADESLESGSFQRPQAGVNSSLSPTAQYLSLFCRVLDIPDDKARKLVALMADCDRPGASAESLIPDGIAKTLDTTFRSGDKELALEFFDRSKLFCEPAKLKYKAPDAESFTRLINEMVKKQGMVDE